MQSNSTGQALLGTPPTRARLRKRAWVPFGTANELMRYALFMDVAAHREAIGMR